MAKPIGSSLAKRMEQSSSDDIDRAYDDMFGTSFESNIDKIVEIDTALLYPHPADPFKPYTEDKLKELADSIASIGLLDAIHVRPDKKGGYQILAGKNRTNAIQLNGKSKIKAAIRDVDDDTAIMIVTDSNLKHREKLLPSEKAFAYKLQLDAIKKQGNRSDINGNGTSTQVAWRSESAHIVADHNEVSKDEVRRHIRLTYLIPELLDLVDIGEIPLMTGVDLSQLDTAAQKEVYKYYFELNKGKIDLKTSSAIKLLFKEGSSTITVDTLDTLFSTTEHKPRTKPFTISRSKFKNIADKLPDDKGLEDLFIEFLKERFGI